MNTSNAARPPHLADILGDLSRLEAIDRLGLLVPADRSRLQKILQQVASEMKMPIALVSVVLDGAQFFPAMHGVSGWMAQVGGTPSEWSFCAHAVESRQPFIVADATAHPKVKDYPIVTIDGIQSYVGFPLITSDGHALGALCAIGKNPREFSQAEIARMGEFAGEALREIER